MSTFIVTKDSIDLLVTAHQVITTGGKIPATPQECRQQVDAADAIGRELVEANYAAVNRAWEETADPPSYTWIPVIEILETHVSPCAWLQVYQSALCLTYQSCESPNWAESSADVTLGAIIEHIERELSDWPKSNHGQWEWKDLNRTTWNWQRTDAFPESTSA